MLVAGEHFSIRREKMRTRHIGADFHGGQNLGRGSNVIEVQRRRSRVGENRRFRLQAGYQ